jgi:hypothetical protein
LAKNTQARLYQEGPAVLFEKYRLDVLVLQTEFSSSRLGAVGIIPFLWAMTILICHSVWLSWVDGMTRDLSFALCLRMKQTSLLARCHICWSKVRHGVAGSRRMVCGNSLEDGTTLLDISER